eukprot:8750980-Alexandrium_andersonii.AAC.1
MKACFTACIRMRASVYMSTRLPAPTSYEGQISEIGIGQGRRLDRRSDRSYRGEDRPDRAHAAAHARWCTRRALLL